jgi:hypothetical protein
VDCVGCRPRHEIAGPVGVCVPLVSTTSVTASSWFRLVFRESGWDDAGDDERSGGAMKPRQQGLHEGEGGSRRCYSFWTRSFRLISGVCRSANRSQAQSPCVVTGGVSAPRSSCVQAPAPSSRRPSVTTTRQPPARSPNKRTGRQPALAALPRTRKTSSSAWAKNASSWGLVKFRGP